MNALLRPWRWKRHDYSSCRKQLTNPTRRHIPTTLAFMRVDNTDETTINFVPPVRPSFRTEQLSSHLTDFYEIWHLRFFWNSVEKIPVSLKPDTNNGSFTHEDRRTFITVFRWILLTARNVLDRICGENKEHILCSTAFFPPPKIVLFMR